MEAATVAQWAFFNEVPIPQDVSNILVPGEQPYAAFATTRDSAIFTSQRLIVRDAQGITGRKVEIYSLPYKNINMWSTENAGTIDMTAEVELWTRRRPYPRLAWAGHITYAARWHSSQTAF